MDAFEVDDTVAPVMVLRLQTGDVGKIEKELRARMKSLKQALPYAPVVVDLAALDEASALEMPLHDLAERLRACRLLPVGAANLPPSAVWNAAAAGMAVVRLAAPTPTVTGTAPAATEAAPAATAPEPPPTAPATAPVAIEPPPATLTIRQPVRSGQVIYAKGADLVVIAPVNPGAQLIADGHIHVYGPLRGRALAGAGGRLDACVFCQSLDAELVAIAGHHVIADEIPAPLRGRPTQLFVEDGRVRLQPL